MKTLRKRLALTHTLVAVLAVLVAALLASPLIIRAYVILESRRASALLTTYYEQHREWDAIAQHLDNEPLLEGRRLLLADTNHLVLFDNAHQLEGQTLPMFILLQGVHIRVNGQTVGYVAMPAFAGSGIEQERIFLRQITFIIVTGSLIASNVALLVALFIAKHLTQPLRSLTAAARSLATGEWHQPLKEPPEKELADLSRAFNTMAHELSHQENLRRQLMADIAHELRTPLSVLQLQLEGLEDGIENPAPHIFASLSQEVSLLTRLVEDLRLLSLADAGQLQLTIEPLEPSTIIQRILAIAEPRARQQGIAFHTNANSSLPFVLADPQRLQQMLLNLIENALRYTPQHGRVTLHVREHMDSTNNTTTTASPHTPIGSQNMPTPTLIFEVEDTGPGIAPDDIPHIFERFYRTDRARSRETGGSGLGLAIVQRLVEAQHGQVGVASTLGQGTTFWVILPSTPSPHNTEHQ